MKVINSILYFLLIASSIQSQSFENSSSSKSQIGKTKKINTQKVSVAIDTYLDHKEKIGDAFNGQILVCNDNDEIFYRSRGYAHEEFKVEPNRNTAYNLASISKMLTALVVLKMKEDDLVDINAPINQYINELVKTDIGESTIYELLTHSSGLPEPNETYLWEFVHVEKHDFHIDSITNHLNNVNIDDEDKGETDYTNLGAILTSLALERITGKSYEHLLQKYLIDPLGLTNTGMAIIDDQDEITSNKAKTYEQYYGTVYEFPFAKVGLLGAAAGLHSSIADLQKILSATFIKKSFLSPSSLQILTEPFKAGSEYGFGCFNMQFSIDGHQDINVIGHEGYIWGVSTAALYLPQEQITFVLLSNRGFSGNIENDLRKLIPLLLGAKVDYTKMRLDIKIMQIEEEAVFKNFVNGLQDIEKLREDYQVSEDDIDNLGYDLIEKRKYQKAQAVLKLNCRLFSTSSNTYDSLGEVQYLLKDLDNSLVNYKRSLELDPDNENAKTYILKINELKGH